MTRQSNTGDEDFALTSFEFPEIIEYDFKPWHRPRKQYIRAEMWGAHVGELLNYLDPGEPLRYFGLPGADFLDIRYFVNEFCADGSRKMRFLGFDIAAQDSDDLRGKTPTEIDAALDSLPSSVDAEIEIERGEAGSLASIRRSPHVDPRSKVLKKRLESIAAKNSIGRQVLLEEKPFDIVNLDLCGSIFPKEDHAGGYHTEFFDAVRQIFALQKRRSKPWLLFLTCRIDDQAIPHSLNKEISELIRRNLDTSPRFRSDLQYFYPQLSEDCGEGRSLQSDEIMVGIAKWLVRLGTSTEMDSHFIEAAAYRVTDKTGPLDMGMLAFKFDPILEVYGSGLTMAEGVPLVDREPRWAALIPKQVRRLTDVDGLMEGRLDLKEMAVIGSALLLAETGRYSIDAYEEWVRSGEGWKS
ncbi:hypothetical protein [Jidongwangia harbinensis]|uniref:hypothetical protein n=1 Tax=Jidongwangia harbinensis TaxID=2878561 RepID=UPI001CDA4BF3|nr:hypothetical protein [Jidongwangia harbinensis]MCA2219484.1 hypothetical protein [Jidongwangia harbinensis]